MAAEGSGDRFGSVVVVVTGIKVAQGGDVVAALFGDEASWLDADRAFARLVSPVVSDSAVFTFDAVPFDSSYAMQVFHDRNRNGKVDFRKLPFPKPKEGVGVSHNTFRMGPPDYRKARFTVSAKTMTQAIELRY